MRPRSAGAVPLPQPADDVELGRAVHGQVDLVALHLLAREHQGLRPRVEPAQVAVVEDLDGGLVVGVVVFLLRAELDQRRAVRLGQLLDQAAGAGHELGDARRGAREHEPLDAGRAPRHVLDREPSAPRLAEQVAAPEPEGRAHLVDLLDRPVDRPQGRVVGAIRAAAAELVVHDHRPVVGEPLGERDHVVAGGARAAVQEQDGRALAGPEPGGPDAPARDLDAPLLGLLDPHRGDITGDIAASRRPRRQARR